MYGLLSVVGYWRGVLGGALSFLLSIPSYSFLGLKYLQVPAVPNPANCLEWEHSMDHICLVVCLRYSYCCRVCKCKRLCFVFCYC
jgi:hypothetical protein